jgi:hypothetical protein
MFEKVERMIYCKLMILLKVRLDGTARGKEKG